jgi:hypothetical protein
MYVYIEKYHRWLQLHSFGLTRIDLELYQQSDFMNSGDYVEMLSLCTECDILTAYHCKGQQFFVGH